MKKIGLIAGGGELPMHVLKACEAEKHPVFVVGIQGQTNPELLAPWEHIWVKVGQVGKVLESFHHAQVSHVVLAGSVRRPSWTEMGLDRVGLQWMGGLLKKSLGDDALLSLIIQKLEAEGFQILSASSLCSHLTVSSGAVGSIHPSPSALEDIIQGVQLIRGIYGAFDVGQAVVIQEGLVLGLEAIEGTDALIRRCGALKRFGMGPVLVKLPKPGQSEVVDMPTIGPETLKLLLQEGFQGVALEAGKGLVLNLPKVLTLANEGGCFIWGVEAPCHTSIS